MANVQSRALPPILRLCTEMESEVINGKFNKTFSRKNNLNENK